MASNPVFLLVSSSLPLRNALREHWQAEFGTLETAESQSRVNAAQADYLLWDSALTLPADVTPALLLERPVKLAALLEFAASRRGAAVYALGARGRFLPASRLLERIDTGERASLTQKEAELLAALCAESARPVSRDALLARVWGYSEEASSHTLETHLYRLRQKLRLLGLDDVQIGAQNGMFAIE